MKCISMYKALLLLVGVLMPLLFACTRSYPGLEYEDDNGFSNGEGSTNTPIMLFLNDPLFFTMTTTRGTGVFEPDNKNKYNNATFHVFAFRDAEDVDMTMTLASDSDRYNCLVDGDVFFKGRPMKMDKDNSGEMEFIRDEETNVTEHLYYGSKYQELGYNFFGYYIDDFEPTSENSVRTKDEIYHNVDIDGSQDIMCGYSRELTPEYVLNILKKNGNSSSTGLIADRNNILNYGYSTYAAHRNVNPVIDLKHVLARLKFEAYAGDNKAQNITITNIEVKSRTKGKLTVAAADLTKVGLQVDESQTPKSLYLKEASVDGVAPTTSLRQDYYKVELKKGDVNKYWANRTPLPIGESLLVMPSDSYQLIIHYNELRKESEDSDKMILRKGIKAEYTINAPKLAVNYDEASENYKFKGGYAYTIKIAVYGLQPIEVSAQIEGWKEGGSVGIDPDENPNSSIDL